LAARSLEERNFRFALRAYYLANLAWLGRRELLTIHPGKTNREYELELRRKARSLRRSAPPVRRQCRRLRARLVRPARSFRR
jgi:hypothetical protein